MIRTCASKKASWLRIKNVELGKENSWNGARFMNFVTELTISNQIKRCFTLNKIKFSLWIIKILLLFNQIYSNKQDSSEFLQKIITFFKTEHNTYLHMQRGKINERKNPSSYIHIAQNVNYSSPTDVNKTLKLTWFKFSWSKLYVEFCRTIRKFRIKSSLFLWFFTMKSALCLLFLISTICSSYGAVDVAVNNDIVIKNVDRVIDIATQITKINYKLVLENGGSKAANLFHFVLEPETSKGVAYFSAEGGELLKSTLVAERVQLPGESCWLILIL